jgi:hypothetical protein
MTLRRALPIIKSMKEHFNARAVEWGMAGWAVTTGLMLFIVPDTHRPGFPFTAEVLGILFIIMGLVRGSALFINGLWRRTPAIRLFTSALSAFMVTWLMVGISQGPPSLGSINFFFLFLADCMSAKRATEDWLEASERKLFYDKSISLN